jgi:AhpD family alkylhydroperoxidase
VSNPRIEQAATRLDDFEQSRSAMNERIFEIGHLGINRFFSLDSACYRDGALDGQTKELLGLVASLVLRCDDCVDYHLIQCVEVGWSDEQIHDALNVGLVVGGSIVIPHLRHAVASLDALRARAAEHGAGDDGV